VVGEGFFDLGFCVLKQEFKVCCFTHFLLQDLGPGLSFERGLTREKGSLPCPRWWVGLGGGRGGSKVDEDTAQALVASLLVMLLPPGGQIQGGHALDLLLQFLFGLFGCFVHLFGHLSLLILGIVHQHGVLWLLLGLLGRCYRPSF